MDTQEFRLAILHKVISELGDAGKTRIQKIGYFIQEAAGIPTKYPFRMHHYGPYSESLETDVARLELTGYIDVKQDHLGFGYHITPVDEPLEDWVRLVAPHEQQIGTVLRTFGRRPTHELELAATIHFVKGLFPSVSTGEILQRVRALKPRFDGTHIRESYEELEQLSLIGAEIDEDLPF